MKCGKCGTPILPGEDYCRICGTKYGEVPTQPVAPVTEVVEVAAPVAEIIEPPVEQVIETLEVAPTVEPPVVETLEVESPVVETLVPPVVETIVEPVAPAVETITEVVAEPIVETLEVAAPVIEELVPPVVETLEVIAPVVEEISTPVVETIETPVVSEIAEPVIEPVIETPVVEVETPVEEVPTVMEVLEPKETLEDISKSFELAKELDLNTGVNEEETKVVEPTVEEEKEDKKKTKEDNEDKSIEEIIAKNNKKPNVAFIVTLILLIVSLSLNVILFMTKPEDDGNPTLDGGNQVLKTIYYEDYAMNIDYNWIYTVDEEVVFNDKTENWGASLQIIKADYNVFSENKDTFNDILNNYQLEMTSKTEKVVNNKTVYIFSGKYNNYITDVVIANLGNDNLVKVQLLYKGEKDDIVQNKVLEMITAMSPYSTNLLNDTTFKFESLEEAVLENSVSKVAEESEDEKTE